MGLEKNKYKRVCFFFLTDKTDKNYTYKNEINSKVSSHIFLKKKKKCNTHVGGTEKRPSRRPRPIIAKGCYRAEPKTEPEKRKEHVRTVGEC